MEIRFVAPDLRRLDALDTEALAAGFFEDERPLQGVLGLVDWRLCGRISRLILEGRIEGHAGEKVLMPLRPRLPFEKLFLFGLGPKEQFGPGVFERCVVSMLDTLCRANVRASAMALPGRSLGLVEPGAAMERFMETAPRYPDYDEVTLVDDPEAQKAIEPVVQRVRRRARAPVDIP